jgi:hypothetical protein
MTEGLGVSRPWYESATRWSQLTFVENDPLHFDIDAWTEILLRTRSNAICISAGGYIAYYPTRVDGHYVSRYLDGTDLFGSVVSRARSLGMRVVARVDPHAVHADTAAAHPEWLARDSEGAAIEHPSHKGIWLTCAHTTYHSEFLTQVSAEIVRDYEVDGIFANRWEGFHGVSHSWAAQESFRAETGRDLPVDQLPGDPLWVRHARWRATRLNELMTTWDRAVRDVRPTARFIPNRRRFQLPGMDAAIIERTTPAYIVDKQGRAEGDALWATGRVGKRGHGTYPDRQVNLITSVGPEVRHRWKDSVDSPAELLTTIADGILHGANPWFAKFNSRLSDSRWIGPVADAFALHAAVEHLFRASTPIADVVLLESTEVESGDLTRLYAGDTPAANGAYHALVEARIPFSILPSAMLSSDRLDRAKAVVIPDARGLSVEQISVLRSFVERGGSLLATDGSIDSSSFARTPELWELFGVRPSGTPRVGLRNNYVAITGTHPISRGFDGAERIVGGTSIIPVVPDSDCEVPFRFVPDFPDLPMEEVYAREAPRDPAVVCRTLSSGGRCAFVAFDLGGVFWDVLQADHARLIANLVDWVTGGEQRVRVDGVGLVDLAVRETEGGLLIGLVNLDNPMAMRGQLHSVRPLAPQSVSVSLPPGVVGADARLVVADAELPTRTRGGRVTAQIPSIEIFDLVEIRWNSPACGPAAPAS